MTKHLGQEEMETVFSYYAKGYSFRETAKEFGRSMQSIHHLMQIHAPHLIRKPYIGRYMSPAERLKRCRVTA